MIKYQCHSCGKMHDAPLGMDRASFDMMSIKNMSMKCPVTQEKNLYNTEDFQWVGE